MTAESHSSDEESTSPGLDVFAAAPDGIVVVDEEGVIVAANGQTAEMFGYAVDELVGEPIEILIPERFRSHHVDYRKSYTAAPKRRPMGLALELFGRRKTGEEFPVEISLNYERDLHGQLRVIAFVRDATAKREMERELRASEESFRLLVEGVEDYAIVRLDPSGAVASWNPGAQRIKGWTADEIIGRHFSAFYLPEDIAAGVPERELERAAAEGRVQSEGWRMRADGRRFWAESTLSSLRDENGTLRGFAKVTRDRTEHRQARARLESIAALNRAVLENQPQEELLELIAQRAHAMLGNRAVVLWSPTGDGTLTVSHAAGEDTRLLLGTTSDLDSVAAVVARSGRAEIVGDLAEEPRVRPELARVGFGSGLYVALRATGETFAVVTALAASSSDTFQPHEVDLLQSFGMQAAVSLAFARARAEAEQLHLVSERERIARELHDTVIQRLFAVGLALEATSRRPAAEIQERLQQAVGDIDDTIRSIRSSIFTLETRTQAAPSLRSRVVDVVTACATTLGFDPTVSFDGPVDTLTNKEITDSLVAVLREVLTNVGRHACARSVAVEVSAHDDIALVVTDDGTGSNSYEREGGHGVHNLRERARLLGGSASIEVVEPHGTRVRWTVPLPD